MSLIAKVPLLRPVLASRLATHVILCAVGAAALLCLWTAWCEFPIHAWNEARLAPAFVLRQGINPYPAIGGGPLLTWIYGPIGILINLPATFAVSAAGALRLGFLINAAVLILPIALILFDRNGLCSRDRELRWLGLSLAILFVPHLEFVFTVVDHAAIFCGLMSGWYLARKSNPGQGDLMIAALFCGAAIWSKQTTVAIVPAQLVYLFLAGNHVKSVRYCLYVASINLLILGVSTWCFGWNNLWLNLIAIPKALPWADSIAGKLSGRIWWLVCWLGIPGVGLTILRSSKLWPPPETSHGRFFQLSSLVFVMLLPAGVAAFLMIGGDTNSFHSWSYLMPAATLSWLAAEKETSRRNFRIFAVSLLAIILNGTVLTRVPAGPAIHHLEIAEGIMEAFPHAVWFPRNPIITYYSDHTIWHCEDGIETRFLAGYGIRESDFRRHLPIHLKAVVYPSIIESPFSLSLLPEFNDKHKIPHWNIYVRTSEPTPQPKKQSAPVGPIDSSDREGTPGQALSKPQPGIQPST